MIEIWIDDEVKYPVIVHNNKRMKLASFDAEDILKIVENYIDKCKEN